MPGTPIDERRFTDREVREILKKAVEGSPSRALAREEGLSLAELKAIGAEVGIDPDRLEDAARAVSRTDGGGRPNALLGGALLLNHERKVEGELDSSDTPDVLALIRRIMGQQGEVDEIHGSLEWKYKGDSGERYVTVTPREGTTTLQASANLTNGAVVTYLPGGIVGFLASLVGFLSFARSGNEVGLIAGLLFLPILYAALRTIFGKLSKAESAKLQKVVDELARLPKSSDDGPPPVQ
jgi:hypothetical protein